MQSSDTGQNIGETNWPIEYWLSREREEFHEWAVTTQANPCLCAKWIRTIFTVNWRIEKSKAESSKLSIAHWSDEIFGAHGAANRIKTRGFILAMWILESLPEVPGLWKIQTYPSLQNREPHWKESNNGFKFRILEWNKAEIETHAYFTRSWAE